MKTILVVDDEQDFCRLVKLMLQREPYRIDCAYTLKEAAQKLEKEHPAIVILDHNLPDGTGLEYVLNAKHAFESSRIILITADPSPLLRQKAENAGVHFLPKPFGLKKIREMIKQVA